VYGNRAALALFNCTEQELLSRHLPDIDAMFHAGGWPEFISELRKSRALERQAVLLNSSQNPLLVDLDNSIIALDDSEFVFIFAARSAIVWKQREISMPSWR